MARYIGAKQKIARKFREPIFGESKAFNRRPHPTVLKNRKHFVKQSEYSIQLQEKQKTKHIYGILEKQFLNLYKKANASKGVTGENLMRYLECRLDNIIFRMGFAYTRRQARQIISHKHIMVNNIVVNIPSYQVKIDDVIAVRPRARVFEMINNAVADSRVNPYKWIEVQKKNFTGILLEYPNIESIPENINVQNIIELYSK